jgi:hypothetical protein
VVFARFLDNSTRADCYITFSITVLIERMFAQNERAALIKTAELSRLTCAPGLATRRTVSATKVGGVVEVKTESVDGVGAAMK